MANSTKTSAWKERGSRNLTYDERRAMLDFLLTKRVDGTTKLMRHAVTDAATKFSVDRRTVSRLWKRAVHSIESGEEVCDVASRKVGRRGRRKRDWSAELERVKEIPLAQRGSIRALATAVGIPKTTLFELLKEEGKSSTNAVKPSLTAKNKLERLRFCAAKVRPNGLFDDMYNVVHVNMRWFALPRAKKTKVMAIVALARPQWDPQHQELFNGKIGMWPFLQDKGQALETVHREDVQRMLTEVIVPTIRRKLPAHLIHGPVYIQQDSSKIRCTGDAAFALQARTDGWNIQFQNLPPFSPDLTLIDSGIFNTIQAKMKMIPPSTLDSAVSDLTRLVSAIERGFALLTTDEIDDAFLALQKAMEGTMRVHGSNTYELGSTSKNELQMNGSLPVSILCHPEALIACRTLLDDVTEETLESL